MLNQEVTTTEPDQGFGNPTFATVEITGTETIEISAGEYLVVGRRETQLFDLKTEELVWTEEEPGTVYWLGFSHDKQFVITCSVNWSNRTSIIRTREIQTGKTVGDIAHPKTLHAAAASPVAMTVAATTSDSRVLVWDFRTGKKLHDWPAMAGTTLSSNTPVRWERGRSCGPG